MSKCILINLMFTYNLRNGYKSAQAMVFQKLGSIVESLFFIL